MSVCPQCGENPSATTTDATTDKPYYECSNCGNEWADDDT